MPDDDKNPDDASKGGTDDGKAKEAKPEVAFKTKGEVERKARPLIAKAVEDALKPVMEAFGVESLDDLPAIAEGAKKSKQALSETEQIKRDHDKLKKDHAKLAEKEKAGSAWRQTALRKQAITQYATKVTDLEIFTAVLEPKLVVSDDDDTVTGPNGKSLDDYVEELLKNKPILKRAEIHEGSGTNGNAAKAKPATGATAGTNGTQPEKRPALERVVADMVEADRVRRAGGQA